MAMPSDTVALVGILRSIALLTLVLFAAARAEAADAPSVSRSDTVAADSTTAVHSASGSRFKDPSDGWFDMSGFLESGHGFIPLAAPVTEPAFGYGVGGGLVFLHKNETLPEGGYRRPNMFFVGGLGTNDAPGPQSPRTPVPGSRIESRRSSRSSLH